LALGPADILAAKRRPQCRDAVTAERSRNTRFGSVADRPDRDRTLAADSSRTVRRHWSHTRPNNVADRPDMNKALAPADSHQVLRRACRVDRNKSLAVDSPEASLGVDSLQVAIAAEHTAQRHQLIRQVQARSQQGSIWRPMPTPQWFAIAYAKRVWQHEGIATCKKSKIVAASRSYLRLKRHRSVGEISENSRTQPIPPCPGQPSNANFHHFLPVANRADTGDREKAHWRRST
jgi:hypothetical protein